MQTVRSGDFMRGGMDIPPACNQRTLRILRSAVALAVLALTSAATAQEPDWTVEVGAIALKKGDPDSTVLFVAPGTRTPLLNASEFSFGFEWGADIALTRNFSDGSFLKARAFGIEEWTDRTALRAPTGANLNANPPVGEVPPPLLERDLDVEYVSDPISLELNYGISATDDVKIMAGFRYVEINEELDIRRQNPAVAADHARILINTYNALWGGQLGADATLHSNDFYRIDGFIRAGVFANNARNRLNYVQTVGPDWVNEDDTVHTSWLAEIGLTASVRLTEGISLKAGYEIICVADIAEAGEQVPRLNIVRLPNVGNGIDVNGATYYHGATVQLVFEF